MMSAHDPAGSVPNPPSQPRGWARVSAAWEAVPTPTFVVAFCLVCSLAFAGAYLSVQFLPGDEPDELGWWAWFDQQRYLASVEGLTRGEFRPGQHFYPPGYPLLGAIFHPFLPRHPFFFPNLAAFVTCAAALYGLARRFFGRLEVCGVLALVFVACRPALTTSFVLPWSTVPAHAATCAAIFWFVTRPPSPRLPWQLGLLAAFVFVCRPLDAALLAPLLVASVLQLPDWPSRLRGGLWGLGATALGPLLSVGWNLLVFGEPVSPYAQFMAREIGFFDHSFAVKAYGVFLDGYPIYREVSPVLLESMPWLLLVAPGVAIAARELGWRLWPALATAALTLIVYVGYNNMSPVALTRFSLVHYLAWLFPFGGLATYMTFRRGLRELPLRWTVLGIGIPVALAWCVRLEEVDGIVLTTDEQGRVHMPAPTPGGTSYDLFVVRNEPKVRTYELSQGGELLSNPRDLHLRRDYHERTSYRGYAAVFAAPRDPTQLTFVHPDMRTQAVEFRRLRWSFTALPPMLHKLRHGRAWGADPLVTGSRHPASDLETEVGHLDPDGVVRATGTPGALLIGPSITLLPGRYAARWTGTAGPEDELNPALGTEHPQPGRVRVVEAPTPQGGSTVAELAFEIFDGPTAVEFQLTGGSDPDTRIRTLEIFPQPESG